MTITRKNLADFCNPVEYEVCSAIYRLYVDYLSESGTACKVLHDTDRDEWFVVDNITGEQYLCTPDDREDYLLHCNTGVYKGIKIELIEIIDSYTVDRFDENFTDIVSGSVTHMTEKATNKRLGHVYVRDSYKVDGVVITTIYLVGANGEWIDIPADDWGLLYYADTWHRVSCS